MYNDIFKFLFSFQNDSPINGFELFFFNNILLHVTLLKDHYFGMEEIINKSLMFMY